MTTLSWPNFCLLTDWEGESAEYEGSENKKMQFLKHPPQDDSLVEPV